MNLTRETEQPHSGIVPGWGGVDSSASTLRPLDDLWNRSCHNPGMDATSCTVTVGYARVAAGSTLRDIHEHLSIVLIIDNDTHRILEVDSTAVTGVVQRWLASLLTGRDITSPLADALQIIEANYLGVAAGAIRQALVDAARRYAAHIADVGDPA